eukprot:c3519_g1_i1 orf=504-731(-)
MQIMAQLNKRQPTVATSSEKVEYMETLTSTIECVWLGRLSVDFGIGHSTTTSFSLTSNSPCATRMTRNLVFHACT